MNKTTYSILPFADGQPPQRTQHPATYQEALTGGAMDAGRWLANPEGLTLVERLDLLVNRMPGSAVAAVRDGFLLRLDQRLKAASSANIESKSTAELDNQALKEALQASLDTAEQHIETARHQLAAYADAVQALKMRIQAETGGLMSAQGDCHD